MTYDDECLQHNLLNPDETEASEVVKHEMNTCGLTNTADVNIVQHEDMHVSLNDSVTNGNTSDNDDKIIDDLTDGENDDGDVNPMLIKRAMFIHQATCKKNCYRYTGLTREKVLLVFGFVKEQAKTIRYWRGSVDTCQSKRRKSSFVTLSSSTSHGLPELICSLSPATFGGSWSMLEASSSHDLVDFVK